MLSWNRESASVYLVCLLSKGLSLHLGAFQALRISPQSLKGVNMKNSLPKIHWIEIPTMELWLKLGTIWETDRGSENVYFTDEFGLQYFCKCL